MVAGRLNGNCLTAWPTIQTPRRCYCAGGYWLARADALTGFVRNRTQLWLGDGGSISNPSRMRDDSAQTWSSAGELFPSTLATVGTLNCGYPWLLQVLLRLWVDGTGLELVALSSFGWATLLATLFAQRARSLGTCVVCSGFLTLLVTCSSDHGGLWCWPLVGEPSVCGGWRRRSVKTRSALPSQHGARDTLAAAAGVLLGCAVFALAAWSVAGRFPASQKLPWELAPTSGGTGATDPFARSGVGDGDALVAARENAASFGAVDSDLLLDSKEASLFDLYSDTFGEPVRKTDVERTVALAPNQTEVAEPTHMAQSDGASAALTTQRRPAPPSKPLSNRPSDALLFWIGRPDTHLPSNALPTLMVCSGLRNSRKRANAAPHFEVNRHVSRQKNIARATWQSNLVYCRR